MKSMDDLTYGPGDLMVDVLFPMLELSKALRDEANLMSEQIPKHHELSMVLDNMANTAEDVTLPEVRALLMKFSDLQFGRAGTNGRPDLLKNWLANYKQARNNAIAQYQRVSWMQHFLTNMRKYRLHHSGVQADQP